MGKFYICEECGELKTQHDIEEDMSAGGHGLCYCNYMKMQWDRLTEIFEPVHFREFKEYTAIPEKVYNGLLKEKNTVLRLEMFRTWK